MLFKQWLSMTLLIQSSKIFKLSNLFRDHQENERKTCLSSIWYFVVVLFTREIRRFEFWPEQIFKQKFISDVWKIMNITVFLAVERKFLFDRSSWLFELTIYLIFGEKNNNEKIMSASFFSTSFWRSNSKYLKVCYKGHLWASTMKAKIKGQYHF